MLILIQGLKVPAQIVGVRKLGGKPDLSIHIFHSHYVHRAFVSHFTCPEINTQIFTINRFHIKVKKKQEKMVFKINTTAQAGDCEERAEIHSSTQRSWCQSSNSPQ